LVILEFICAQIAIFFLRELITETCAFMWHATSVSFMEEATNIEKILECLFGAIFISLIMIINNSILRNYCSFSKEINHLSVEYEVEVTSLNIAWVWTEFIRFIICGSTLTQEENTDDEEYSDQNITNRCENFGYVCILILYTILITLIASVILPKIKKISRT